MTTLSIGKTVLGEGIPKIIVPLMGKTAEQTCSRNKRGKIVKARYS